MIFLICSAIFAVAGVAAVIHAIHRRVVAARVVVGGGYIAHLPSSAPHVCVPPNAQQSEGYPKDTIWKCSHKHCGQRYTLSWDRRGSTPRAYWEFIGDGGW